MRPWLEVTVWEAYKALPRSARDSLKAQFKETNEWIWANFSRKRHKLAYLRDTYSFYEEMDERVRDCWIQAAERMRVAWR